MPIGKTWTGLLAAIALIALVPGAPAGAAQVPDARLQQVATRLAAKMDALAHRYAATEELGPASNPYIETLGRIARRYHLRHPQSGIYAAAALFELPHGGGLFTNHSPHLDWMAEPFVYGPPTFTTISQSFDGKRETYRIYTVPLLIPASYRAAHLQGALAVYTVTR